jgi:hypothetical protein
VSETRTFGIAIPNHRNGDWATAAWPLKTGSFTVTGTKTGEKVPGYKAKIKAGQNASSPYFVDTAKVVKALPHKYILTRVLRGGDAYTPVYRDRLASEGFHCQMANSIMSGVIPHVSSPSTETDNKAIVRLHRRIREESYSVNGLLVLGELRETIGLLRNPFRAVRENFIKYTDTLKSQVPDIRRKVRPRKSDTDRSLSYRRANALKNAMAGTWLEFQFGIKPAISDTEDIVKGLDRVVDTFLAKNKRMTGSAKEPGTTFNDYAYGPDAVFTCGQMTGRQDRMTNSSIRYVAIYRPRLSGSTDFNGRAAMELGVKLENFIPTAWELVPWSFLIDYFVNIGPILECSTTGQFDLVTCVKSVRQQTVLNRQDEFVAYSESPPTAGTWYAQSLVGETLDFRSLLRTTISRTVSQFLPVPQLIASVPGWGSVKWANMAALAANMRDISRFRRG